jgi:hypothetical protein
MINLLEKNDIRPVCPHCAAEIGEVYFQELNGLLGRRYIYFCSLCSKILGVSHRKGFWMG